MDSSTLRKTVWAKWGLIGLAWMFYAVFFASQGIFGHLSDHQPARVGAAMASWFVCSLLWFAVTPILLRLAQRFPIDRHQWRQSVCVHLAASIAISLVLLALFALVFFIASGKPLLSHYRELLISSVHSQVLTYGMVVGMIEGIDYYRKYREREVRAFELQTRLAEAELEALKMQLHPHFLFNTLNSISVLMSEDVNTARRMLTRLSELLRISLDSSGRHEVALKAELEFLSNYLEIERTRFQDRLTVRMEIDPEVLEAQVPNLILQPLVENAIRHGISPRAQPGVIEIFARRENQSVQIQIRDNGAGLGTASLGDVPKGIGIANTEARLNQLYGSAHRFDLKSGPEGGVLVTIEIPFCHNSAENHAGDNSWK